MPSPKQRKRGQALSRSGIAFVKRRLRELGLTEEEFVGRHSQLTLRSLQRCLAGAEVDRKTIQALAERLNVEELDLTDPYGTRFLDWDEIRRNSLDQLPPLLSDRLADRLNQRLNWDDVYINLTLHQRQDLPSYPSIFSTDRGSQFYELSTSEITAILSADDFIKQFTASEAGCESSA